MLTSNLKIFNYNMKMVLIDIYIRIIKQNHYNQHKTFIAVPL